MATSLDLAAGTTRANGIAARSTLVAVALLVGCGSAQESDPERSGRRGARAHKSAAAATASDAPRPSVPAQAPAGAIVDDPALGVHWFADGNLAGDAAARAAVGGDWSAKGPHPIAPNGTMSYPTAKAWVAALNAAKYLGHDDWQLPVEPKKDKSCHSVGPSGFWFGPGCKSSALGHVYTETFHRSFPQPLVGTVSNRVGGVHDLQPGLYWAPKAKTAWDDAAVHTYSFLADVRGRNTAKGNYFFVLPVLRGDAATGPVGGATAVGPGKGVVPYVGGPLAGVAVYDTVTGHSWPADGNLARTNAFGVSGDVTVTYEKTADAPLTLKAIEPNAGTMLFRTVERWLTGMNADPHWSVGRPWALPSSEELSAFREHLALAADVWDTQLVARRESGPFRNVQDFFYWACPSDDAGACDDAHGPEPHAGHAMACAFNFQTGFQGTDEEDTKAFYVMVYYRDRKDG